jgi:hypothetical protein
MFKLQEVGLALNWVVTPLLLIVATLLLIAIFLLGGLPGRIAASRRHRQATAVTLGSWFGLFTIVLWPVVLIWAYIDPPDTKTLPELLSHDDVEQLADALRQTSRRVAQIEEIISENVYNPVNSP